MNVYRRELLRDDIYTNKHARMIQISRTAKTQYRKFETNIPRKAIVRPQSQFHIRVSVIDLYIPTTGLPILLQENKWTADPGNI
jgi:hypothetical protein